MSANLEVGKTYNFGLYPSAILGGNYTGVEVLGIVKPTIAAKYADIVALHAQVFPYLPQGVDNNYSSYDYVLLKTATGDVTVIGVTWINADTVEEISSCNITVVLSGVTTSDITKISNALTINGFNNFTIKTS